MVQRRAGPAHRLQRGVAPGPDPGAWLGRTAGNTLGKPVEGLTRLELDIYLRDVDQYPQTQYLPLIEPLPPGVTSLHPSAIEASAGRFVDVPRDDDIDWTILNLYLLERYGRYLTTAQIAEEWLDRVPFTQTCTAERAAYRNLVLGLTSPGTATPTASGSAPSSGVTSSAT